MAGKESVAIGKNEFMRLYIDCGMSIESIAGKFGVSYKTLRRRMGDWSIPIGERRDKVPITEETLHRMYLDELKSTTEIAALIGCTKTTIRAACLKYGIAMRGISGAARLRSSKYPNAPKRVDKRGYVYARASDYQLKAGRSTHEHRIVAEHAIERKLQSHEQVHHIDLDKTHNCESNFIVFTAPGDHNRLHKYLERCAVYLLGLSPHHPGMLELRSEAFYRGRWTREIDLIGDREPQQLADGV